MGSLEQVFALGLIMGGIYCLVALGLTMIIGVIRVVNFAHGSLLMAAMFMTYFLIQAGMDPYLSLVVVVPIMALVGAAIQRLLIQPVMTRPMMQIFATFGLLILIENIALTLTGGDYLSVRSRYATINFSVADAVLNLPRVLAFVAALAVTAGLQVFLNRTMVGAAIRAVSQDRTAARLIGINIERIYVLAFAIGLGLVGLAGAMLMPMYAVFPQIGESFIFASFAVVVLGGLGSVPGTLAGAVVIGLVETLSGYFFAPELKQTFWFAVFLAALILKPSGILGAAGSEEFGLQ